MKGPIIIVPIVIESAAETGNVAEPFFGITHPLQQMPRSRKDASKGIAAAGVDGIDLQGRIRRCHLQ